MNKFRIFLAFMILVIALSTLPLTKAEAAATPGMVKLTIDNKSLGQVVITLKGPKEYIIYAKVGKTIQEVVKGNYVASFKACGTNQTAKVKAANKAAKLQIKQCKTTLLTVANFSSMWMSMTMVGPDTYYFNVAPGQKEVRKVLSGTYKITATCGGKVFTPTWNVKGKKYLIWCRG